MGQSKGWVGFGGYYLTERHSIYPNPYTPPLQYHTSISDPLPKLFPAVRPALPPCQAVKGSRHSLQFDPFSILLCRYSKRSIQSVVSPIGRGSWLTSPGYATMPWSYIFLKWYIYRNKKILGWIRFFSGGVIWIKFFFKVGSFSWSCPTGSATPGLKNIKKRIYNV